MPTESTPTTASIRDDIMEAFDRTVNAVDELGWDNTGSEPVDDSFEYVPGTCIEMPPGVYQFADEHVVTNLDTWGLRGTGTSMSDVVIRGPPKSTRRPIQIRGQSRNILIENLTLDQQDTWRGCLGIGIQCATHAVLKDIHYAGKNPSEYQGATSHCNVYVFDPNGVAVLDGVIKDGPSRLAEYPRNALDIYVGRESEGTVYIRNCVVKNSGESAIYASRTPGGIRVEGCHFENCQNTMARISGSNSWCKDSVFVWDIKNSTAEIDPNSKLDTYYQGTTGLTFESGFQGFTGGLVERCRFIVLDTNPNSGVIKVDGSHGGIVARDNHLHLAPGNDAPAVNIEEPGDSHMIDGLPSKPWDVSISNLHVTHEGGQLWTHDAAVAIRGRNAVLTNACIDASNSPLWGVRHVGGRIEFKGTSAVEASSWNRRITGSDSIRVGWADVADTATCLLPDHGHPADGDEPMPDEPDNGAGDGTDDGAQEEPPAEEPPAEEPPAEEPPSYAHEALIRAAPDVGAVNYTLHTTGPIALEDAHPYSAVPPAEEGAPGEVLTEHGDGTWSADGVVARGGGDTFTFDGEVVSFRYDTDVVDAVTLTIDGETWTPVSDAEPTLDEQAKAEGWTWLPLTDDAVILWREPGTSDTSE